MQESEIWRFYQMLYAQSVQENEMHSSLGFWDANRSPSLGQTTIHSDSHQKMRTCLIVDFAVPAGRRVKLKEIKMKDKYLDLNWELKKTIDYKVTVIPVEIGAFFLTILKELIKELEDLEIREQVETIQTTVLLGSVWILRRVLEIWGDLLSLKLQ